MFCPACGMDNSRNQKFCTGCGKNLVAIGRPREMLSEVTLSASSGQGEAAMILKIVALVSIFGFLLVTGGAVALAGIIASVRAYDFLPAAVILALGGYAAIILICLRLLRVIRPVEKAEPRQTSPAPAYAAPTALPGSTNPGLTEGSAPYPSVTEPTTRQFGPQRRQSNQ